MTNPSGTVANFIGIDVTLSSSLSHAPMRAYRGRRRLSRVRSPYSRADDYLAALPEATAQVSVEGTMQLRGTVIVRMRCSSALHRDETVISSPWHLMAQEGCELLLGIETPRSWFVPYGARRIPAWAGESNPEHHHLLPSFAGHHSGGRLARVASAPGRLATLTFTFVPARRRNMPSSSRETRRHECARRVRHSFHAPAARHPHNYDHQKDRARTPLGQDARPRQSRV